MPLFDNSLLSPCVDVCQWLSHGHALPLTYMSWFFLCGTLLSFILRRQLSSSFLFSVLFFFWVADGQHGNQVRTVCHPHALLVECASCKQGAGCKKRRAAWNGFVRNAKQRRSHRSGSCSYQGYCHGRIGCVEEKGIVGIHRNRRGCSHVCKMGRRA